ncbi:MAG: ketopantoate reductase C-terminal domain-containing protein [Roseococcus sp.]
MSEGPILIIGAGAVGGYLAAHLARLSEPVLVLEPWAPNREVIAARGLSVVEPSGDFTAPLRVIGDVEELPGAAPRLVILCTKLADAPAWVAALEACYRGDYLVTLNALADLTLAEEIGSARVMGCIVTGLFAHLVAPGELHRYRQRMDGGAASFRLGETAGPISPRIRALVELLSRVDHAEAVEDLPAARWTKLVFNCMTSPLSALHGRPIRDLFLEAPLRAEMMQVALEVTAAADAAGVRLDPICGIDAETWLGAQHDDAAAARLEAGLIRYGEKLDPTAISGMAQDLARGRRTEVALVNGALVAQAVRLGLPCPANTAVITALERRFRG